MSQIFKILQSRIDYGLLAALAIPIFAVMPLLTHAGLPNTADGPAHLMRQVELNQAWQQGDYYIRWGADLALGHGMPIFNYTPPLLYQVTQLFHLTGLPLDESMKLFIILDFLLYSVGMFLFARRIFGPTPALLAAAVHVYAPYRLREAYIQGSYGQFNALALYPLILWAFHGLVTDGRPRYLMAASLSLAALLLSHNISALHFAPILAAYLLFLLWLEMAKGRRTKDEGPRSATKDASRLTHHSSLLTSHFSRLTHHSSLITLAGLLGLGLSAIYWLPAFGERGYVQFEKITQGFFDFRHHFLSLPELLAAPVPLDLSAINPEFPLSLGLPQIIAAAAGIAAMLFAIFKTLMRDEGPQSATKDEGRKTAKRDERRTTNENQPSQTPHHASPLTPHSSLITPHSSLLTHHSSLTTSPFTHALFFTLFFLLFVFLTLPPSEPIWEIVPLLELTEFPWRMLGPAIFCASILAAAALSISQSPTLRVPISQSPISNLLIVNCALFIVIFLNIYYLYPSQFIPWGTPTPADAFAFEVTTGAIGTNSAAEMLPRWAQQPPRPDALWPDYQAGRPPQKLDPSTLPAGATASLITHRAERTAFQVDTPQPFVATLRTLYWPGWQVYLNDKPVPFTITKNTGLIQTEIPAGQHTLTLRLEPTPIRTVGQWLSGLSLAGLGVITTLALKKSNNPKSRLTHHASRLTPHASRITHRFFLITAAILIAAYLISRPLAPLFTLQSNPDAPQPAGRNVQVDFTGQIRLVGVDMPPEVVELHPGQETGVTAVLYWRALQNLDTNYAVFLHLDGPNGQTFATVDETNPDHIPTGSWPPGLYLRNPLQLRLPASLPPIRYTLSTGLYNPATGRRLPVQPGNATTFALGHIWLVDPQPGPAPPAMATFGPHVTLHQAQVSGNRLALLWQTNESIEQNYSIFIHLLNSQGNLLAQADGVPYDGLYPLPNWRPGQLISDTRRLDLTGQPQTIVLGIYSPATGQRLPARDAIGRPLPNNSLIIPVSQ